MKILHCLTKHKTHTKMSSFKFLKAYIKGDKTTILFNKSGLSILNNLPNAVELNEEKNLLKYQDRKWEKVEKFQLHKLGEVIKIEKSYSLIITNMTLTRLDVITEEEAKQSGIKANVENQYKHFCPELLYPTKVLQDQKPGFPFYYTAKGSFYSLWMKNYGIADIYKNPWVWKYEIAIIEK